VRVCVDDLLEVVFFVPHDVALDHLPGGVPPLQRRPLVLTQHHRSMCEPEG